MHLPLACLVFMYVIFCLLPSSTTVILVRQPGTTVPDGLMFYPWCIFLSFFVSPLVLRAPSTNRPETLPHGRNVTEFYNPTSKMGGRPPPPPKKRIGGQKHAKFPSILHVFACFRLWSRISPERLKLPKISKCYKLWQFLLRWMEKVCWTLVH